MMLEVNRKRPREYSTNWTHDHTNVFNNNTNSNSNSNSSSTISSLGKNSINYQHNSQDDIIVLDSDDDEGFSFTNQADSDNALIDDFDNDSDVVILKEEKIINSPPNINDDMELSNHSIFDYSMDSNFDLNGGMNGLRPFKKPRTKSLPQLPHSRISYHPPPNLHQLVTTKVGEIKTNYVPFNELNYTFSPSNSNEISSKRRISFASGGSTKKTNGSVCDDKKGHYIVNAGESFANGRFRIKKLLGQGTFGKVISAYDNNTNEVVAIKIIRAVPKYREASKIELRVLSTIKKHDPNNRNHCIHLRECFDYRSHICIVTDLLNISLFDFLQKNNFKPFPGSHIQAVAKQLIRSVAFLHDLKLIHTDLKPENILLHNNSYVRKPYKSDDDDKITFTRVLKDPLIQIIDFGSAIFDDEYHSQVVSTRHYRAPEIVLNIGWSFPCDMWSVGCVLVELATGEALFKTHENLEHLAMMEKITGKKIDIDLVKKSFNKNRFYGQDDVTSVIHFFDPATGSLQFPEKASSEKSINLVESLQTIDEVISGKVGLRIDTNLSLKENYLINEKIPNFDDDAELDRDELKFWYNFIDLIKKCLTYNPEKRLKAIDAMEHPWFDLGIYDNGTLQK